ncbi:class I SAM-dependent methyltransferase [Specibacter cremeus]|uniref:class I SAM-dependent methyltransferase n=1 Tax=Specibacter cremeus TaxID=1629051 RepID=UPI000F7B99C2|nr:class I SAM-dependent methyltransferase [Specibacter cremeus]
MTQHSHRHAGGSSHEHSQHHESGLADLLDLDAAMFGSHLEGVTTWARQHAPETPRTVVDVGAGTGSWSLALARRFPAAGVVAIDKSPAMLDRVRAAALGQGLADRVDTVHADLDDSWPAVGAADIAWAASSLHEVADPDRVLRDIRTALAPGGLLVVVELDTLPRFLPDDVGLGRPGLEARCHEALARAGWNAHPDWRGPMERAGFEIIEQRRFAVEARPDPLVAERYARAYLGRIRHALDGRLAAEDLSTLDHLLAGEDPGALLRRGDLAVSASRTAWAARQQSTSHRGRRGRRDRLDEGDTP